jgi:hypothetical protein
MKTFVGLVVFLGFLLLLGLGVFVAAKSSAPPRPSPAAARAVEDPGGFQGLKWGSARAAVAKALKGAKREGAQLVGPATIDGRAWAAVYDFTAKDELARVVLGRKPDGLIPNEERENADFKSLESALTEKYGPPVHTERRTFTRYLRWLAGRTAIVLRWDTLDTSPARFTLEYLNLDLAARADDDRKADLKKDL